MVLRELKLLDVSVQFEEDHIDTETLTSEMMVSVFSSLAQQESISISQNQQMSYQRRMERGEYITNCAPYGYRIEQKKYLEIVPEEAEVVRWIFEAYLQGDSMEEIVSKLNAQNIVGPSGSTVWYLHSVHYILSNEKYIGRRTQSKELYRRVSVSAEHQYRGKAHVLCVGYPSSDSQPGYL